MNLPERLVKCLDTASGPPTDIRFVFQKVDEGNSNNDMEFVKAHRFILAVASDVFEREFFGTLKESGEDIEIKDATYEVFKTMVDFIYMKNLNLDEFDLNFLSSLYNLGEKYNIRKLREEIISAVLKHEATAETVFEIATLGEANNIHEPLSEALYEIATLFLMKEFGGRMENVLTFFSEASVLHALIIFKMMAKMKSLFSLVKMCGNCKCHPCLHGSNVTEANFVQGAEIMPGVDGLRLDLRRWLDMPHFSDSSRFFLRRGDEETSYNCRMEDYLYRCY